MDWIDERYGAFDFETSGKIPEYALQPWRFAKKEFWPTSLVWIDHQHNSFGGLFPNATTVLQMLTWAIENKITLCGWNLVFDISVCVAMGFEKEVLKVRWLDGMLLWRHLEVEPEYDETGPSKRKFGLKACVEQFLPDQAGYNEDVDFHATDPDSLERLHGYNIRDSSFSLILCKLLWSMLNDRQRATVLIEAVSLPLVAIANTRGMLVDTIGCGALGAKLDAVAARNLKELEWFGVTEKIVRSPAQLSKLMFDDWKLPVQKMNKSKTTGKETRSTDKNTLHELAIFDPRARQLREYREALNNKTKFVTAVTNSVEYNDDWHTHPLGHVFGTYTGRLTYASKQGKNKDARQIGFAIHQEKSYKKPGDEDYRAVIVLAFGRTIVEFDAAGQEFRWMAIQSGDPVMLQMCMPGEDAHTFMTSRIIGRDYQEVLALHKSGDKAFGALRKSGKAGNLSLQYRTSWKKFLQVARVEHGLDMKEDEAKHITTIYPRTYAMMPRYWERRIAETKALGYVETLSGRRVKVEGDWSKDAWRMGSTGINYPVQGTGAEQKYLAIAAMKPLMTELGARFFLDMHDGLYYDVPDENVEAFATRGKAILDNLPYFKAWGFKSPIPLPFDVKYGKTWGSLKEFKFD